MASAIEKKQKKPGGLTSFAKSNDATRLVHLLERCVKTAGGCMEFHGCVQSNGYARATVRGKTDHAYRHVYRLANGVEIPSGIDVCHSCDNRRCINPEHLFLGTRKDNMQDAVKKSRVASGMSLPQSKLSNSDKLRIKELAREGISYADIADQFNISRQHAGYIAIKQGVRRDGIRK